jgi:hypothetical protein
MSRERGEITGRIIEAAVAKGHVCTREDASGWYTHIYKAVADALKGGYGK